MFIYCSQLVQNHDYSAYVLRNEFKIYIYKLSEQGEMIKVH